jgi:hypothetical protein
MYTGTDAPLNSIGTLTKYNLLYLLQYIYILDGSSYCPNKEYLIVYRVYLRFKMGIHIAQTKNVSKKSLSIVNYLPPMMSSRAIYLCQNFICHFSAKTNKSIYHPKEERYLSNNVN